MSRFAIRSFVFITGAFLLGYMFFFVQQWLQYPEDTLLYFYKTPWIFEEALRLLIEHFPVISVSAVLLAFSTYPAEQAKLLEGTGVISVSTSRTIILFLVFTLIYSILSIGLLPELYESRHNRIYQSSLARSYLQQAETAEQQGNLVEAYSLYRDYLSIDSDTRVIKEKVNYLEGQLSLQAAQEKLRIIQEEPPDTLRHDEYRDMSSSELVEKGHQALDNNDPFTAHYMALIAQRVAQREDQSREDAKRLAARAWEAIGAMEPSREKQQARETYNRKVSGYEALTRQQPVKAYYIFKELRETQPGDPDVKEYYRRSLQQAQQVSYFIDEAERFKTNPGIRKIFYMDTSRTLVFIEKLVIENGDHWAYGIELINLSETGTSSPPDVLEHMSAPFGKISGETLIMKGIDRNSENRSIEPTVYVSQGEDPLNTVMKLAPSIPQLMRLSREQEFINRLTLPDLLKLQPVITQFGYPAYRFEVLTLLRILEPFLFLIFATFAIAFGWHTRVHKSGFPWLVLIVAPLLPFVLDQLVILYEYLHKLLLTAVVLNFGFVSGAVGLLILQALLLFLALFSVALQKEL
ncbi:MAG: hypothetical protein ACOC2R_08845 [Spirochaetota bacterium]